MFDTEPQRTSTGANEGQHDHEKDKCIGALAISGACREGPIEDEDHGNCVDGKKDAAERFECFFHSVCVVLDLSREQGVRAAAPSHHRVHSLALLDHPARAPLTL